MNLLSKSAPLEDSISKMHTILEELCCGISFSQDKHPLPHCYSVNLTSVEAPNHIYSNGKGSLLEASNASALGEYIERLQTNNFFIDFHLPSRLYYPDQVAFEFGGNYLSDELRDIYDANGDLCDDDLIDFNSDYEDKIVSLPFLKSFSNEQVYIPLNILSNLYVSNGLASGNTPNEAKVQALSEIFERYAKMQIIKNGYALPSYPDALLRSFSKLYQDVSTLRSLGFIVEVLDASLGGKYPVTAISLINPKNATLFVSFGSHPILEVSLERTMSELMQGRGLDNLDTFEVPTFDMDAVSNSSNLESHFIDSNGKMGFGFLKVTKDFIFTPWQYGGKGSLDEYRFLEGIVKAMGKEIYLREYTYLGFYSCQMLIPSISEVYPIEDLVYNNKNNGKFVRDMILNFQDYDTQEILEAIQPLEESLNIEKYIGVIFENNFTMLEFKAHIHLLEGNTDEALELLEYGENKMGLLIVELIRMKQQNLLFEEYEKALCDIYTKSALVKAFEVLQGQSYLIDVTLHKHYIDMLKMYDKLDTKKSYM